MIGSKRPSNDVPNATTKNVKVAKEVFLTNQKIQDDHQYPKLRRSCPTKNDADDQVDPLLKRVTSQLADEVKKRNQQRGLLSKIVSRAFWCVPMS